MVDVVQFTPRAAQFIVDPIHPPEYRDFILVFPADSGVRPVYVVLSVPHHDYHPAPKFLPAYPDATHAKQKTRVKGGSLRRRWKLSDGKILEWDYQHGALEIYDKRGRHLREYDPETGAQTKSANSKRRIEP